MYAYTYEVLDTSKLISEIKKRGAIYNKNHTDYNNKDAREELWTEICWALFPNWSDLEELERQLRFKDVQKKWRNVRDSFRKELNFQRKLTPGSIRKKRQYVYFRQLKFLLPFFPESDGLLQDHSDNSMTMKDEQTESKEDSEMDDDESEVIKFKFEGDNSRSSSSSNGSTEKTEETKKPVLEMWDNSVDNGFFNGTIQKDIDEDKYFLLSLIPSFRTLTRQQKLSAKVEFLQVLQRLSNNSNSNN